MWKNPCKPEDYLKYKKVMKSAVKYGVRRIEEELPKVTKKMGMLELPVLDWMHTEFLSDVMEHGTYIESDGVKLMEFTPKDRFYYVHRIHDDYSDIDVIGSYDSYREALKAALETERACVKNA